MREGLLWFDNDPRRSLEDKIRQAAARYLQKFGVAPSVCYVSDKTPPGGEVIDQTGIRVGAVHVWPSATVQPNHFWIGQA